MHEADLSALGPIDPGSVSFLDENEDKSPWIVRKILGVSRFTFLGDQAYGTFFVLS